MSMSRRPRKTSMGKHVEPADDTEKQMSDPTRPHSRPSKLSQSGLHHDYSAHEITNVPAPIPDTGLPPPSANTTSCISSSQVSVAFKACSNRPSVVSKTTFAPLPSLKTLNLTGMGEVVAHSSSLIHTTRSSVPVATPSSNSHNQNRSGLSTAAIVAFAVGGAITLFVVAVLIKLVKHPRRRRTPTPSLPIPHDGSFPGNKAENEGSPIFGGRERSSPTIQACAAKGDTGLWTWTQYDSGIPKPAPMVTVTRSSSQNRLPAINQTVRQDNLYMGQSQVQYPFVGHGISKTKGPAPPQPVQNAITRAVSRLSTVSMTLYPNSPGGYSQVGMDVGLAIDGVTHDEPANVTIAKYNNKPRNRTSIMAPGGSKDAVALRRSQAFAYGGIEPTSPLIASPNRTQINGGRARIKSTYFTSGSYPRGSAAATNYGKHDVEHGRDGNGVEQDRIEGSESRRGRDPTLACGLTSLIPPSPQLTLYPDDSMSVIGEAKKVTLTGRSQKKPAPKAKSQCDSPPPDATALGSLMMVDFAASKSTASLVNIRPCEAARAREGQGKSNLKKKVEDKPPRVPSPPPIPSLTQMALQQAEPDYHSPTYSIYGLYDGDGGKAYGGY